MGLLIAIFRLSKSLGCVGMVLFLFLKSPESCLPGDC